MKTFARTVVILVILYIVFFPLNIFYHRARNTFFPKEYHHLVFKQAEESRLDPLFLAALIYVESSFRPQAESKSGAMGLMQLMPSTAEQVVRDLEIESFNREELFDPKTNLKLGCDYLNQLSHEFKGLDDILMAYNAGRSNLLKWRQEGENPLNHAFPETRKYVIRIRRLYQILSILNKIQPYE